MKKSIYFTKLNCIKSIFNILGLMSIFLFFSCNYETMICMKNRDERPFKRRKLNNEKEVSIYKNQISENAKKSDIIEKKICNNKIEIYNKKHEDKKKDKNKNRTEYKIRYKRKKRKFTEINRFYRHPNEYSEDDKEYDHKYTMKDNRKMPFMDYIRQGKKHAEARVNSIGYKKLKVNDRIFFHNHYKGIICKITFLHRYDSFEKMISQEGALKLLPQIKNFKRLKKEDYNKEALQIYKSFPGSHRVKFLGCLAIGLQWIKNKIPNNSNNKYYR